MYFIHRFLLAIGGGGRRDGGLVIMRVVEKMGTSMKITLIYAPVITGCVCVGGVGGGGGA